MKATAKAGVCARPWTVQRILEMAKAHASAPGSDSNWPTTPGLDILIRSLAAGHGGRRTPYLRVMGRHWAALFSL